MNRSLDEFVIEGIVTTIPLHKKLLNHSCYLVPVEKICKNLFV